MATRVAAAHRAGDAAALAKIAAEPGEDPFFVVNELLHAPAAALGGTAEPAFRAAAAGAYAEAVESARPTSGRVRDWLARLRAADAAGNKDPQSPRARLHAYGAVAPDPKHPVVVAEGTRWRVPIPDLTGDPALLLLACAVAADWHDSFARAGDLVPLARALLVEALRIGWSGLAGFSRFWLATALHVLRQDTEALQVGLEGAETWKAQGRGDRAAYCLMVVAQALDMLGDVPAMERALVEAHDLLSAAKDAIGAARARKQLATAIFQQGRVAEAVGLFEDVVEETRRLEIPANLAAVLFERASMWSDLGNHERAVADAREAAALHERTGSPYSAAAGALNFGILLQRAGLMQESREALSKSIERFRALGRRREAAEATTQLARALTALQETGAAMAAVEEAVKDLEALGDRTTLGNVRMVWSDLLWSLNRKEEAVDVLGLARADFEAAGVLQGVALVVGNRGVRVGTLRRFPEARAAFEEAIGLWTRLERPEMVARNFERLAAIEIDAGKPLRSLKHVRRCLETRLRLGAGLGDDEARGGAQALHRVLGTGTLAAIAALRTATDSRPRLLDDATWFAESSSGLFLSRGLSERRALLTARAPAELSQADARARERVQAALGRLNRGEGAREAAQAELEAAYSELEAVVARVQREARRVAELVYPSPRTRGEIAAALADDEALVLYQVGGEAGAAVVVRRGDAELFQVPTKGVEAETAEYLRLVASGAPGEEAAATRLYERLVKPLEAALEGVRRVLLAPDGPLHLLPFAALRGGAGSEAEGRVQRLGERLEIAYVPSGTVLLALKEAQASAAPARGVIALGDPVYPVEGASSAEPLASRGAARTTMAHLVRLPETADEARALAGRFPAADRVLLLRGEASRERLLAALQAPARRKAIHLACHAILDVARPRLCGVALAGGDLFTAADIDLIDVPADLVVLSACETGRGRIERGEGVAGLTRSFLLAGASRVLVSLWNVDDHATRLLMDAFYDGLYTQGLPAARALTRAQQAVRAHEESVLDLAASRAAGRDVFTRTRPYADARYWAAWCLWGLPD